MSLSDLPQELVEEILDNLPTKSLLFASQTSKFIHNISSYLIHRRLRHAIEIENYRLIYECYLPSEKCECSGSGICYGCEEFGSNGSVTMGTDTDYFTVLGGIGNHPYNFCKFDRVGRVGDLNTNSQKDDDGKLNRSFVEPLGGLYTHFTPHVLPSHREENREVDSSDDEDYQDSSESSTPRDTKTIVSLDSYELFTQICSQGCLVKLGPKRGLFESVIPVFENFFRVKRDWLEDSMNRRKGDGGILWIGMGENVGLKMKVGDRRYGSGSNLFSMRGDDDVSVSYAVEYQELVIRTAYLLDMIEKSKNVEYHSREAIMLSYGGI